jgi:hypothetical protein
MGWPSLRSQAPAKLSDRRAPPSRIQRRPSRPAPDVPANQSNRPCGTGSTGRGRGGYVRGWPVDQPREGKPVRYPRAGGSMTFWMTWMMP